MAGGKGEAAALLPKLAVLAVGETALDLGVVQLSAFARRGGGCRLSGMHALEGHRMRGLVRILALQCHLDVFELLTFARQGRIRAHPVQHGHAGLPR